MFYLKAAIVIVTSIIILTTIFMIVIFNPADELNRAQEAYLSGNIQQAMESLALAHPSLSPMQYHLYQSYLDRADNNLEKSTKELQMAEQDAADHANFPVLLEILLNQAYNAYMSDDMKALEPIVKKASKYGGPDQDWVLLFRGIIEYHKGNYAKASDLWKLDASRVPLSAWMGKDFSKTFTNYWLIVRIARSNIEVGKIPTARMILEEQIPLLSGEELQPVLFLIGYSYAKEAGDKGPLEAIPYYKLAVSYFRKIPFLTDKYKTDRESLIKQVNAQVEYMLQGSDYKDLPYYLTLFDAWEAHAEVDKLKSLLLDQFKRSLVMNATANAKDIYNVLKLVVPEGSERQALEQLLQEGIAKDTVESLDQYARSGKLWFEAAEALPVGVPQEDNLELSDHANILVPIAQLLEKALDDHKINAQFNVERSIDLQKAYQELKGFVKKYPDNVQANIMLGQILYLLGDFAGSAKAYEAAILRDPRDFQTYQYMALVYEAVGQSQDAILLLLQSLRYAPKNADIWEHLAGLYLVTGNELDAQPSFKEALRIDPERYELYLALGRLQVKLEIPEEARKNLQKYLKHNPESEEGLKLLLMALYNPLLGIDVSQVASLDAERKDVFDRLYRIAPEVAEKIRKGYQPTPAVVSPPPEPEPNLPFLPQ